MTSYGQTKFLLNQVKRQLSIPCAPTPMIWIETFFPSLIFGFLTSQSMDVKELITQTTGKSWLGHAKDIAKLPTAPNREFKRFAVTENIEVEVHTESKITRSARHLFTFTEGLDMAAFWFFVAGVVAEGLIEWHSLAYRQAGCRDDVAAGQCWSNEPYLGIDSGRWQSLFDWKVESGPYVPVAIPQVVVLPGHSAYISCEAHCRTFQGKDTSVSTRIINYTTGDILDQDTSVILPNGGYVPSRVWASHANYDDKPHVIAVQGLAAVDTFPFEAFPKSGTLCFSSWRRRD